MPSPRRLLFASCVVALAATVAACGSSSDDTTAGTTTSFTSTTSQTSSSTAPLPTVPPSSGTSVSVPQGSDAISVAVYWTRPYGTARVIDMAAYRDPEGGPYPYVLFGSVTNQGAKAISEPRVIVDWYADGVSIHQATAQVLDPQGQPLASLEPGTTADLIVVVDDETLATPLPDAQPSFGLAQ
jgi:hypothetical protein